MNEALPKLLRSIASGTDAMASKQSVIFNAAADEIERLRAALKLAEENWYKRRPNQADLEIIRAALGSEATSLADQGKR